MRSLKFILLLVITLFVNPLLSQNSKPIDFKEIELGLTSNTVKLIFTGVESTEDLNLLKNKLDSNGKILSFNLYNNNGIVSAKMIVQKSLSAYELRSNIQSIGFDLSYKCLKIFDDSLKKELIIKENE